MLFAAHAKVLIWSVSHMIPASSSVAYHHVACSERPLRRCCSSDERHESRELANAQVLPLLDGSYGLAEARETYAQVSVTYPGRLEAADVYLGTIWLPQIMFSLSFEQVRSSTQT